MNLIAELQSPLTVFEPAFAQRALLAVVVVAAAAGALGGTIVLRDLPFFTHAVGTGAYPVLVLGVIGGFAIAPAAILGALVFAVALGLISGVARRAPRAEDGGRRDALTGIAVAAALALGAVLAAGPGGDSSRLAVSPEALLFGSILTVNDGQLLAAAAATLIVLLASWLIGDRWLAGGFDPGVAGQLKASRTDLALLVCIALAAGATLPLTGSLLAGAMLVIPAATARIVARRAGAIAPLTFALALVEGAAGLYLSLSLDLPTGAAIAAVSGGVFLLVAASAALRARPAARPLVPAALLAVALLALSGCGDKNDSADAAAGPEPVKIVATTPQVADLAANVGGESAEITTLLPAGADPHEFEPKPSAVAALADADVIFRSGGDLDAWLTPAVKAAGTSKKPVDLSQSVVLLPAGDEHGDEFNAHWYLAPDNVIGASGRMRDELIKAQPALRETFRANAADYAAKTREIARILARCAGKVPEKDRVLLAGHNDFDYLAGAFGFEIAGQIAENGESEPSARDVQQAVDAARDDGARAVVASNGEVSQLAEQVANKLDVPLLELYADSLAKSGPASTLLGSIADDVRRIVDATSQGAVECRTRP